MPATIEVTNLRGFAKTAPFEWTRWFLITYTEKPQFQLSA